MRAALMDRVVCLGGLVAMLCLGCGRSPAPPPPALDSPPVVADADFQPDPAESSESKPSEPSLPSTTTEDSEATPIKEANPSEPDADPTTDELPSESLETDSPDTEATDSSPAEETSEPPQIPAERIMLLTQSGPLIADLHITIGGRPFRQAFQSSLADVLKIADSDEDGQVTWDEIMTHPRFREGQFGNPPTTTYQGQQDMIRLYDSTANGKVDPDELVRYLTSNQGTAQPITLVTSNSQRSYNRDKSALREWLDINGDLVLDADEIAVAAGRLRLRDRNDDEILTASDFTEAGSMQPGMARRRPKIIGPPKAGWLIRENEQWNEMLAGWETLYSVGSPVTAPDLMLSEPMFAQLNIDEDQILSAYEMEMLTDVEPHMSFGIELGRGDEKNPAEIKLTALRLPIEQTEGVIQHQPNRITIQLPDTSLDVFASDAIGFERFEEQAANYIERADADDNNYLSEDEFMAIGQFLNLDFEAVDVDDNEMVFQDEIVMLLGQRNLASRSQLRVKADDQDDALWQSIDVNSDGRIDSREIAAASESLAALDSDEDGEVQLHELRGSMVIGVVRGANAANLPGDQAFRIPTVVRQASEATPRWFIGMDRNRDQGISWREFLGSREQFDALDLDRDGFLDLEEASRSDEEAE